MGAPELLPEFKLAMTLWFLATGNSYRTISEQFGFGESTVCYSIRAVIDAILE